MKRILLSVILLAAAPAAQAASLLQLRGSLADDAGKPMTGTFLLDIILSPALEDGTPPWREARYVRVENGAFTALVGDKAAISEDYRRDGYRLQLAVPAGTGWKVVLAGAPSWLGEPENSSAAAPVVSVETPPASPAPATALQAAPSREGEIEAYKRRIEALERAVERGVPLLKPQVNIYTVQKSDTLRGIAQKLYGNSDHWVDLYRANSDRIRRGGELTVGQKLLVPKISK